MELICEVSIQCFANVISLYKQCITIVKVIENEWFKKGYKPPIFANEDVSLDDVDAIFNESRVTISCLQFQSKNI